MPKTYIYSVRNYGSRKESNDFYYEESFNTKTKMVTRSVFKPGQDTYECLSPWHHGITKRPSYGSRDRRRDAGAKSYHHLSLVTRFYLGLRMTRMRSSVPKKQLVGDQCDKQAQTTLSSSLDVMAREKHQPHSVAVNTSNPGLRFSAKGQEKASQWLNEKIDCAVNVDQEHSNVIERETRRLHLGKDEALAESKSKEQNDKGMANLTSFRKAKTETFFVTGRDLVHGEQNTNKHRVFGVEKTRSSSHSDLIRPPPSVCGTDIKELQPSPIKQYESTRSIGKMEDVSTSHPIVNGASEVSVKPAMAYTNSLPGFRLPHPCPIDKRSAIKDLLNIKTSAPVRSFCPMSADNNYVSKGTLKLILDEDNHSKPDGSRFHPLAQNGDTSRQKSAGRGGGVGSNYERLSYNEHQKVYCGENEISSQKDKTDKTENSQDNAPFVDHASRCVNVDISKKGLRPREKTSRISTQINASLQTSSSNTVKYLMQSSSFDGKSDATAFLIPGKGEMSMEIGNENYHHLSTKERVPGTSQSQKISPRISESVLQTLNESQLRVATLGPNIPVFLSACDSLGQKKLSIKDKQLSPIPAEGMPHTDWRQGYGINNSSYGKLNQEPELSKHDDLHASFKPLKGPASVNDIQKSPLIQTYSIVGCAKESLFSPVKYQKDSGNDSVDHRIPAEKESQSFQAFPGPCMQGSSHRPVLPQNTVTDSINIETDPVYHYTNKFNNISTTLTDTKKLQRMAPPLFRTVQTTAGEALVFLSPSSRFHKPTTTPTISQSRQLLPNVCGDGASPLMPYSSLLRDHNITFASGNAQVNHSLAFMQQNTLSTGARSLQMPVRRPASHSSCEDVYYPSATQPSSINVGSRSSSKASQGQPPPTLILLTEQRDFATPAFDLLSSVAKSPAASEIVRLQRQSTHGKSQQTSCSEQAPLLPCISQTRNESDSHNFQLNTNLARTVCTPSVMLGTGCFTSKDHGYDLLSSRRLKRLKRHSSGGFPNAWPVTSNHYNDAVATNFDKVKSLDRANIFAGDCIDEYDATRWLVGASSGTKRSCPRWEVLSNWDKQQMDVQAQPSENTITVQNGEKFTIINKVSKTLMTSMRDPSIYELSISSSGISHATHHSSSLCVATTTSTTSVDKSNSKSSNGNTSTKPARADNMCPVCCRIFTRSWLLKGHMRTHTGERPYQCPHPACQKAFADRSNLRSHMLTHSAAAKNFSCPRCGRTFSQKRYLHKHATEVCKVNPDG
ncbi:hypothetical protein EGW08_012139 [Elysia chlorotica]|uniref:C2H2-type domain-containing protein n=1 Tax=Elysia chlorotica TaxID=188477 RepID=A0A3S1A160_ELYCH|nr:hypothetical protein EGW08_012139 [Elysia chlorotica]